MTDTTSSTPEPSRPQPGSEPSRPQQRFRLPDPQASAAGGFNQTAAEPRSQAQSRNPAPTLARPGAASGGPGPAGSALPGGLGGARVDASPKTVTPPEGRYGEKRGMSKPRKVGLGVVGLAVLGGVGGYIAWQMSHPAIQGTVTGFNATSATSVVVTFEVDKPADKTATCTLVAVDGHGDVIGTASIPILSGRAKNVQTYTLQTTTTANTVTVQSCKLTG